MRVSIHGQDFPYMVGLILFFRFFLSPEKTNIAYIHVHVLDQNEPPVGTDVTVQLREWVPSGTTVDGMAVLTFEAVDPDNNINSWILLSASNSFAISSSGVLTIATASGLNYEDSPVINLQVRVLDSNGLMEV